MTRQLEKAHPVFRLVERRSTLYAEPLLDAGPIGAGWSAASVLADADSPVRRRLLDCQRAFSADLDRKGQASYLIAQYAYMLATVLGPAFVVHGIVPDLSSERLAIRLVERSMTFEGRIIAGERLDLRLTAFGFVTDAAVWADCPDATTVADRAALCDHARLVLEAHMSPLIARLRAYSGLSSGALWRLVGDSVAAVFLEVGQKSGHAAAARRDALTILKREGSPLANRQLGFVDIDLRDRSDPARVLSSHTFLTRGGCCRYYTVAGGALCATCVNQKPAARDARLRDEMRRRFDAATVDLF